MLLKYGVNIHYKYTAIGAYGVHGANVLLLVEDLNNQELGSAIVQYRLMAGMIAMLMALAALILNAAMKMSAKVIRPAHIVDFLQYA